MKLDRTESFIVYLSIIMVLLIYSLPKILSSNDTIVFYIGGSVGIATLMLSVFKVISIFCKGDNNESK